ncbi:MAG: tRNA epoxyqueuosine(34) reductase QueG [Gammaproteobacteria bacterium]|nr:tRNA epoxyqueuosine(34) reductase QueG [Gammaproteobacteria bacterium]
MTIPDNNKSDLPDSSSLVSDIKRWAAELGFQKTGISDIHLETAQQHLLQWLERGMQGEMEYMSRHGEKRWQPQKLVENTCSVISVRMDYLPPDDTNPIDILSQTDKAYISRYALGRDYHKVMRKRLQQLAARIEQAIGTFGYRVFVDSAPVMEKAIAEKAGLGWVGKHSNLLSRESGSWFFLGEIYVDIDLPVDQKIDDHCGKCTSCIDECPTNAIIAPYVVDARRCISYLTIELHGSIPVEFRKAMGNRIYGCDDCQLYCPWNRFATTTTEKDFGIRHYLHDAELIELFLWNEEHFLNNTEGSPIRRIGYERWLRNIAVALGNTAGTPEVMEALESRLKHPSPVVREHVIWSLAQHHGSQD